VVNWSVHLKQKNVPHLVGALDEETAKALTGQNIKNFRVILADAQVRVARFPNQAAHCLTSNAGDCSDRLW
jgi:hypothetical protein